MNQDEEPCTPPELREQVQESLQELLPKKSAPVYLKWLGDFEKWCEKNNTKDYLSENIALAYFNEAKKRYAASTLWTIYSCLKKTLLIEKGVNIESYKKLEAMLKNLSKTHQSKKSKSFTREEIDKFLESAPNADFLREKLVLLIGLAGAMRSEELTNTTFEDIKLSEEGFKVTIKESKTDQAKEGYEFFVLKSATEWKNAMFYYQEYTRLVSDHKGRFFRQARHGRFTKQCCGRSFFLDVPKRIANYLHLPEAKSYTGHALRRTAATWMANAGASTVELKKFGRWKSDSVAGGYVDRSYCTKRKAANIINGDDENSVANGSEKRREQCESSKHGILNALETFGTVLPDDKVADTEMTVEQLQAGKLFTNLVVSGGTVNINVYPNGMPVSK